MYTRPEARDLRPPHDHTNFSKHTESGWVYSPRPRAVSAPPPHPPAVCLPRICLQSREHRGPLCAFRTRYYSHPTYAIYSQTLFFTRPSWPQNRPVVPSGKQASFVARLHQRKPCQRRPLCSLVPLGLCGEGSATRLFSPRTLQRIRPNPARLVSSPER